MARTELPASVEQLQLLVLDQRAELADQRTALADQRDEVEAQRGELETQQAQILEQASLISFLQEWKRLMESQRFGSRSERLVPEQGHLFNEAETLAGESGEEPGAIAVPEHTRNKGGRRPLPDFLPVREILHDLSDEEKICPHDPSHTLAEIKGARRHADVQFDLESLSHLAGRADTPRTRQTSDRDCSAPGCNCPQHCGHPLPWPIEYLATNREAIAGG